MAAPVKAPKSGGVACIGCLAARMLALALARGLKAIKGVVRPVPVAAVITGAVMGEALEGTIQALLPNMVKSAGGAAKEMVLKSGESFGLFGGSAGDAMRMLQPQTVAMYLGSQLLTVVSKEVAAIMLAGMKRNMRDRIRVR